MSDLLVGYLDPTDHVPAATQVGADGVKKTTTDDDDEEGPTGPDPEEAKKRFGTLKRQYNKTLKVIADKGRDSDEAKAQQIKLGEAFCCFKLVPKHFDEIVSMARGGLDIVRRHERTILTLAVRQAKVPRDVFRKEYVGNETSVTWINKLVKADKDYSQALENQRDDILRAQKKLKVLTKAYRSDCCGNQRHQSTHVVG